MNANEEILGQIAAAEAQEVSREIAAARRTPQGARGAAVKFYPRFDALLTEWHATFEVKSDCKPGCSHCCSQRVDVLPHELFALVDYVRTRFNEAEIVHLLRRAEENAAALLPLAPVQRHFAVLTCPLLGADGLCTVYAVRPTVCRKYHSSDVAECRLRVEHPVDFSQRELQDPHVNQAAITVMMAVQTSWRGAGFDTEPYDLSIALAEALHNPKLEKRWRDGKKAFSAQALRRFD